MKRISKRDFLFIDESGDPGRSISAGSSEYFAIGCLHLSDIELEDLHRHYCGFGYFREKKLREIKSNKLSRMAKDQIADILKWLYDTGRVLSTVVFLDKKDYSGPYFERNIEHPFDAILLRNFVTKLLLEGHFRNNSVISSECDLVFDQAVTEKQEDNLRKYLRGNYLLPKFDHIIQCDSRFVPALQFVDVLVHIVKEFYFGNPNSIDERLLKYVNIFNITHPERGSRTIN